MTLPTRRWGAPCPRADGDILNAVEEARREYLRAVECFQSVTEPELVDWAVHLLCAAERRYAYLSRVARGEGVRHIPQLQPEPATLLPRP